jgi:hypothetical protein
MRVGMRKGHKLEISPGFCACLRATGAASQLALTRDYERIQRSSRLKLLKFVINSKFFS